MLNHEIINLFLYKMRKEEFVFIYCFNLCVTMIYCIKVNCSIHHTFRQKKLCIMKFKYAHYQPLLPSGHIIIFHITCSAVFTGSAEAFCCISKIGWFRVKMLELHLKISLLI